MSDTTRSGEPMPLSDFPEADQARIADAVAVSRPPAKWITHRDGSVPMFQLVSRAWHEWYRQRGIDPDRRREKIPTTTRRRVIDRDGYVCQLCGGTVEPDDVHLDHIYPRSLGGSNEPSNLQVAHSLCNMKKGASTGAK